MPHLIVRAHACVAYSMPLEGPLRAGREIDNDLVIPDARISRHHLEIVPDGPIFLVRDLGSTHGIFVNGDKSPQHRLRDGDVIQFGSALLTYRAEEEPSTTLQMQRTDPSLSPPSQRFERRLQLLCAIGETVGSTRDGDAFVHRLVTELRDVLGCERVIVGLGDSVKTGIRKIAASNEPMDDVVVSRAILETVLERRERAIFEYRPNAKVPATLVRERIVAVACVPIVAGPQLYGFLYVDDRRPGRRFNVADEQLLVALAHLTAGVLDGVERLRFADERETTLRNCAILGESPVMDKLRRDIEKYGPQDASVLVSGESGTGKELVAKALHAVSPRRGKLLVAVNCAAIPQDLIESELFGYRKGAFSGATKDKPGKFELANGGTLFLDEIGDLSLSAQAKMLRVLQEGEIDPIGGKFPVKVDVRIVAATHKDLRKEIEAGRFRGDLYYRLARLTLKVPALREREGDVELLARTLLPDLASRVGKRFSGITPEALGALRSYSWPGNVRELLNALEKAVIDSESSTIEVDDLGELAPVVKKSEKEPSDSLAAKFASLDALEEQYIIEALDRAKGNMSEAARLLGITWIMLRRRAERYGLLKKPDKNEESDG